MIKKSLIFSLCLLCIGCDSRQSPGASAGSEQTSEKTAESSLAVSPASIARSLSQAFKDTSKKVVHSVVNIAVVGSASSTQSSVPVPDEKLPNLFESPERNEPNRESSQGEEGYVQKGMGSGVVVDAEGHILTNAHVVVGAEQVIVRGMSGVILRASVIKVEPAIDLAVIKVESPEIPPALLGDSDAVSIGEWVIAIGNPFGLDHTVTSGIISARGRTMPGASQMKDLLQTDAAINPGNSGGPLVNLDGEVVGINTAILSRSGGNVGIGFAVPINRAKHFLSEIKTTGGGAGGESQSSSIQLPALGFTVRSVEGKVTVSDIQPNSTAENSGLRVDDRIVAVDESSEVVGALQKQNAEPQERARIVLQIIRKGAIMEVILVS
jgi:serine protease Do